MVRATTTGSGPVGYHEAKSIWTLETANPRDPDVALFAMGIDTLFQGNQVLTVSDNRLKLVRIKDLSWWKRLTFSRTRERERVAAFVAERIQKMSELGLEADWLDPSDEILQAAYARLSRSVTTFNNPIRSRLSVQVFVPHATQQGIEYRQRQIVVLYDYYDTVEKIHSVLRREFFNIDTSSCGKRHQIPDYCFDIQCDELFPLDDERTIRELATELPEGILQVAIKANQRRFDMWFYKAGVATGMQTGALLAEENMNKLQPPENYIDRKLAAQQHFHSDRFYRGFLDGFKIGVQSVGEIV